MLFKELIAIYGSYTVNHTKPTTSAVLLTIKKGGTYSNHWALRGYEKLVSFTVSQ